MALQRADGSLDFAYDTSTGASVQVFRTGTIAGCSHVNSPAACSGGPDVTWASTQHNLIAYQFLALVGQTNAANKIATGVDANLMITPASGQLGFLQGTNDQLRPLDAQTLGILSPLTRGR